MKKFCALFLIVILSSFVNKNDNRKLENGSYYVDLDKEYSERINSYSFILENDNFILNLNSKTENLKINWIDSETFLVKGLTEPKDIPDEEKLNYELNPPVFRISKRELNIYYFTLATKNFDSYYYTGRFVKKQ